MQRLSPNEVLEARRIIEIQASTTPLDGNIGAMGAWLRAGDVQVLGRNVHNRMPEPKHGLPSNKHLDRVLNRA